MVIKLLLLAIAAEALVELVKKAGPVQPVKEWVIRATPFLYSKRMETHLLECPYCMSLWAGMLAMAGFYFWECWVTFFVVGTLVVHRVCNQLHLVFSLIRDIQMDIRVGRGKK